MANKFSNEQIIKYFDSNIEKFKGFYNENDFLKKVVDFARKAGAKAIYNAFRIFYTLKDGDLSITDKLLVTAALGYFIAPIDLIPDFLGIAGLSDDAFIIYFVNSKIDEHITPEIDLTAREQTYKYFGEVVLD